VIDLSAPSPMAKASYYALLVAAIPEETIKFFILLGAAETHVDARRRQDLIMLAAAVSLGFATLENFLFVAAPTKWQLVAGLRALTAVPGHGVDGLAMGALLTAARVKPDRRNLWIASALFVPVLVHAAYDFPLFANKYGLSTGDSEAQFIMTWIALLLTTAIVAIGLCNWILPMARLADQLSGRDQSRSTSALFVIAAGCALLIIATAATILLSLSTDAAGRVASIALCVFPVAMALDLIWTGFRDIVRAKAA
jgi:RsiW-degrading membrane proteinase PrsW (M82 family)